MGLYYIYKRVALVRYILIIGRYNTMEKINVLVTCGMGKKEREILFFNQFLDYGKMQAPYIANRHDMDADYCARYIASGLYAKFLELREKKIAEFGGHYNSVEFDTFRHVMALIKKISVNLNFSACGIYNDINAHTVTQESGIFIQSRDYIDIEKKSVLERPDVKSARRVDVVDILEQWENRALRQARKHEQKARVLVDDEGNETSELDKVNSNYREPCADLLYNCAMDRARAEISRIATDCKNFATVYNILCNGEKSATDRKVISRFKARYNLQSLSLDDLIYLFAY